MTTGWGTRVYAVGGLSLGVVGLIWRDFATVWQPVPPEVAGRLALACIAAAVFVAAGSCLALGRLVRPSAFALAGLYSTFALLWAKRVIGFPTIFATWSGCAEQLALVLAAVLVIRSAGPDAPRGRASRGCTAGFGVCVLAFGASHLLYPAETAAMVPAWLPPGQHSWALVTGLAHLAAGAALVTGVLARAAARLLTAMFAVFGALVWLPTAAAQPLDHTAWAGNALNLALVGAAWVVADVVSRRSVPSHVVPATERTTSATWS